MSGVAVSRSVGTGELTHIAQPPVSLRYVPHNTLEGAPYSSNPATSVLAGPGALTAGVYGVAMGRFGWADPITGRVQNTPIAGARPALVVPQRGPAANIYWDAALRARVLRSGLGLTMINRGEVWARFAGGAIAGQPVYASTVDGSALSGYNVDGELTGFTVVSSCGPGELARISTWSNF